MVRKLLKVQAKNFRSLADVSVEFSDLSVLIGPNGSGKSNLLRVLSFIRDVARVDVSDAIQEIGGLDRVLRQSDDADSLSLSVDSVVTEFAKPGAPDSYTLELADKGTSLKRAETFEFKRVQGRGRRFKISAVDTEVTVWEKPSKSKPIMQLADDNTSALGALARLRAEDVGTLPAAFFSFLSSIRYLDPDVDLARRPARLRETKLDGRAGNLSAALYFLKDSDPDAFGRLQADLRRCLPGLEGIEFMTLGGPTTSVVAQLRERGLSSPIDLADASFGTVRALALLTALHEVDPPALTIIEEVDHGLHPYALDVIVDAMRQASERTQIIVASHSPTLVNRLRPEEIIICDRDSETGESIIPALDADEIQKALDASGGYQPGELWFSGVLDGVPR